MTKKRGNKLGFWFFKITFKLFGLRGSYALLYLVVFYYLIFDRKAVLSTLPYIKRRYPGSRFWSIYKHSYLIFLSLGKQLIDRYVFFRNKNLFRVSLNENELLEKINNCEGKGFIILNSHIGNWQFALNAIKNYNRTMHVVMRPEYNEAVQEALNLNATSDRLKIIHPSKENLGGVIDIINVVNSGGIVAITGDRSYGAEVVEIDFLGTPAYFPCSAFKIAAELDCPIVVLLTHKLSLTEYQIDLSNLLLPKYVEKKNKAQQIKPWVQNYADIVSDFLKKYPHNCFIFHDLWNPNP